MCIARYEPAAHTNTHKSVTDQLDSLSCLAEKEALQEDLTEDHVTPSANCSNAKRYLEPKPAEEHKSSGLIVDSGRGQELKLFSKLAEVLAQVGCVEGIEMPLVSAGTHEEEEVDLPDTAQCRQPYFGETTISSKASATKGVADIPLTEAMS